jgi:hypothetical protein
MWTFNNQPTIGMHGFFCLLFIMGLSYSSEAQDELRDFRSPSNPANVILGNEPSTILRPTSPQAIGTSVSSFLDDGKIKPNVGLEFSPFWLSKSDKKDQRMTFEQYTNQDISKEDDRWFWKIVERSMKRNFAVSVATADATELKGVNIGIGARTKLFEIYPTVKVEEQIIGISEEMHTPFTDWVQGILNDNVPAEDGCSGKGKKECLEQSVKVLGKLISDEFQGQGNEGSLRKIYENHVSVNHYAESYHTFRESIQNGIDLYKSKETELIDKAIELIGSEAITEKRSRERILEAFEVTMSNSPAVMEKISNYTKLIEDVKAGTRLFSIDVAYANLLNTPTAGFDKMQVQQHSFWVTASFSPNELGPIELTGVFRHDANYQHTNDSIPTIHSNYGGLRVTCAMEKFNVSLELLGSWSKYKNINIGDEIKHAKDYRVSINFEYRVTDLICFNFAFGRTFKDNVLEEKVEPMLLVGGINLALPKHLKL